MEMKMTDVIAKKGAIIVIENRSSYTEARTFKVKESTSYFVAKATKVGRDGIVQEYQKADSNYTYPVDFTNQSVMVIGDKDKQVKAKRLYENLKDNWFPRVEHVRDAILAA